MWYNLEKGYDMKIRVFSDIHLDVNERFPFSLKENEKDCFTLIPGDVSGNPKYTAKWIQQNIHNGMFIVGNHDPAYNDLGWTIGKQKQFLHEKFPEDGHVTFLDESVGVMSKTIPGTNILVIGSTLYTDYKYVSEFMQKCLDDGNARRKENGEEGLVAEMVNMSAASRGLNDFRWGHVEDEFDDLRLKQRFVRPDDYKRWFEVTFSKMAQLVQENNDKDIIIMSHHCPTPKCIAEQYVNDKMNASYVSDLEKFIVDNPSIKAWCCGHVHSVTITTVGDNGQLIVCNPRGYERDMENENWNPNTYIDTDTWTVVTEPYKNEKLELARKKFRDQFMKWAPFFM